MGYEFTALKTDVCAIWRNGGVDANGQIAERVTSDGGGNPCRHCLQDIPAGKAMLILAHRPFEKLSPYAEVGPIFICVDCERLSDSDAMPPVLAARPRHLLKGYFDSDRIAYGTGAVVETADIAGFIECTFGDPEIAYIDARSAGNNCYTVRIKRQNS
jgi:hypothetical protein